MIVTNDYVHLLLIVCLLCSLPQLQWTALFTWDSRWQKNIFLGIWLPKIFSYSIYNFTVFFSTKETTFHPVLINCLTCPMFLFPRNDSYSGRNRQKIEAIYIFVFPWNKLFLKIRRKKWTHFPCRQQTLPMELHH